MDLHVLSYLRRSHMDKLWQVSSKSIHGFRVHGWSKFGHFRFFVHWLVQALQAVTTHDSLINPLISNLHHFANHTGLNTAQLTASVMLKF